MNGKSKTTVPLGGDAIENTYIVIDGFTYPINRIEEERIRESRCKAEHDCTRCNRCVMKVLELTCSVCGHVGMERVGDVYVCTSCKHEAR